MGEPISIQLNSFNKPVLIDTLILFNEIDGVGIHYSLTVPRQKNDKYQLYSLVWRKCQDHYHLLTETALHK